jgi:hypothetical protein
MDYYNDRLMVFTHAIAICLYSFSNSDGSELLAAGLWQAGKVQWSPSHMSTDKIQIEETNSCLLALAGLKLLLLLSPITDASTWVIGLYI